MVGVTHGSGPGNLAHSEISKACWKAKNPPPIRPDPHTTASEEAAKAYCLLLTFQLTTYLSDMARGSSLASAELDRFSFLILSWCPEEAGATSGLHGLHLL